MEDKYIIERNTRGFFTIVDSEGKPVKKFAGELFTTERNAEISILNRKDTKTSGKSGEK